MTDRVAERLAQGDLGEPLGSLNARQAEVLRLMASGYTNDTIAEITGAARSTVERWTAEVFRTLRIETKGSVNPRVEAVRQFIAVSGIPDRA